MERRAFLRGGAGLVSTGVLAGCLGGLFDTRGVSEPPVVENPPDAVYYPSHVEGMKMAGVAKDGPLRFGLSYSYPHRFWLVTDEETTKVTVKDGDTVHLMGTVWDAETGTVLPAADLSVEVLQDGDTVAKQSLWPMLSQNMGYHFGDNVSLNGNGQYTARVRVGGLQSRATGALEGKFEQTVTLERAFTYDARERNQIAFDELPEKKGSLGAVEPMEMDMLPVASAPSRDELPGRVLGAETSGDGVFVATVLEDGSRFTDGGQPYLAVSARTPHNQFPLPFMSLSATLKRNGTTVFDGSLRPTIDHELGYHYGAAVENAASADTLTVTVDAPPQVSRHEGYETAFLDMPDVQFSVA